MSGRRPETSEAATASDGQTAVAQAAWERELAAVLIDIARRPGGLQLGNVVARSATGSFESQLERGA